MLPVADPSLTVTRRSLGPEARRTQRQARPLLVVGWPADRNRPADVAERRRAQLPELAAPPDAHVQCRRVDQLKWGASVGEMHTIRPARIHDLPGAYRVCLLTGDAGEDATPRFRDPDLLGHRYVGPYIVGRPEHALIVADGEGVAGYCLAVVDTRAFEDWCEASWWPALRDQYPPLEDDSADAEVIDSIYHPTPVPEAVVAAFPAHLHIDLLASARGQGLGRALIDRQLDALGRTGVSGVHLDVATDNANAIAFYGHLGFRQVATLESSILMGMPLPAAIPTP